MSSIQELKDRNTFLYKEAGEGSMENNIKQLITDDAYTQISQKFPRLVPMILGINVMEIIDKDNAIGGAIVQIGGIRLVIPIVYNHGLVDATTFLYDEERDTMLALTKKVVDILMSPSESISGESFKPGIEQSFDAGNVNSMFVPPKTYNPKIASSGGGLLFAVMEHSNLLKEAMVENLTNGDFRDAFEQAYGRGAVEHVENMYIEKRAKFYDDSAPKALFSIEEIKNSDWIKKEAAAVEYGKNGYVISHGANAQPRSLVKVASVGDSLKKITGSDALEGIPAHTQGIFSIYSIHDLKPINILRIQNLNSRASSIMSMGDNVDIPIDGNIDGNPVIGKQLNVSDASFLKPLSSLTSSSPRAVVVILKDGEVFGGVSILPGEDTINRSLGGITISSPFSKISVMRIAKNSNSSPVILGSTIYVGDENVRVVYRENNRREEPVRMQDLPGKFDQKGEMIKVAFDGVEYTYGGSTYSRPSLVNAMIDEGFDKNSIYNLVKMASSNGSAELVAVNAKLDMLTSMLMNLAGQVQAQGLAQTQPPMAEEQPVDQGQAQGLAQAQPPEVQPGMEGTAMQDPYSGMPSEQQMAEQDQAMQGQASQDQQLLQQAPPAPMDQYAAEGTMAPPGQDPAAIQQEGQQGEQQQQPLQDGMNTAIDPSVLATLAELKDSNVMDVGLISMIAGNDTMNQVMNEYKGNILEGASSVGRILLNAIVKKDEISSEVGEKKYKQLEKNLRTIFIKMSDLYADIMKMGLESDGQVAT